MKNVIRNLKEFIREKEKREYYINIIFGLIIVLWTFIIIAIQYSGRKIDVQEGGIVGKDILIPADMEIVDDEKTELKRKEALENELPYFKLEKRVIGSINKNIANFFSYFKTVEENILLMNDEKFEKIGNYLPKLSEEDIRILLQYYSVDSYGDRLKKMVERILNIGLTSLSRAELVGIAQEGFFKTYTRERGDKVLLKSDIKDIFIMSELDYLKIVQSTYTELHRKKLKVLANLLKIFLRENLYFDELGTKTRIEEVEKSVEPVLIDFKKGQVLMRHGEKVTAEKYNQLQKIKKFLSKTNTNAIAGIFLISMFIYVLIYLFFIFIKGKKDNKSIIILNSLVLIIITWTFAILRLNFFIDLHIPISLFIPVTLISFVSLTLFDKETTEFLILTLGFLAGTLIRTDILGYSILTLGPLSIVLLTKFIKRRAFFWSLGLMSGFVIGIVFVIFGVINDLNNFLVTQGVIVSVSNGLLSTAISFGVLTFFEYILNLSTDYRFYELSDLNNPVLKKMLIEAPGTYHHSIMVANLAESAAQDIGANSLLLRVAGYFHDTGKIEYSEYFTENQKGKNSKHNSIKPSLSASIIKSHIKEGINLAKKLKLPDDIIELIRQHHGKSLITYFYYKALKEQKNGDIARMDYQYAGPKPQTKEAVILMVADAVEAASRALKKPSNQRIEGMIKDIINLRLIEGEFDESNITLGELDIISNAFKKVLMGVFHTRVEYPDKSEIDKLESTKK